MRLSTLLTALFISVLFSASCKKKESAPESPFSGATYFSIRQFGHDQFETYWGQPFTLQRFVTVNGKVDSAYVPAFQVDWAQVLMPFFEADISDPALVGKYRFSMFDDEATDSRTYFYEAIEDDLFTRSFQIITDPFTNAIKSIYIEAAEGDGAGRRSYKLFYQPVKVIQIQEFTSSNAGEDKSVRVEYRFLY